MQRSHAWTWWAVQVLTRRRSSRSLMARSARSAAGSGSEGVVGVDPLPPGTVGDHVGGVDDADRKAAALDGEGGLAEDDDIADAHRRAQLAVGTVVTVVLGEDTF